MLLTYLRSVFLYIILLACVRLMGKRQVGQMEPSEFVVTMLMANLAAVPMQSSGTPLAAGLVPILTVFGAELLLSGAAMGSIRLRRILCGKPVILMENGNILRENLRKTRITLDELTGQLREKDILDLTTVQYAILETNGNLSVFPYPKDRPASAKDAGIQAQKQLLPITLVADGKLYRENLALAGKNEAWVKKELFSRKAQLSQTLLLTVDAGGHILFFQKEARR